MISFLQNLLQKHHKWLFSILLFIIVLSFVFTIGGSPGFGRPKKKALHFYGQDLSNSVQMNEIAENAIYTTLLEAQDVNFVKGNLDFFAIKRIICLGLAKELALPNPSQENLRSYIKSLPIFFDEKGKFSQNLYASIVEMFNRNGHGQDRLKQVLCENYKIKEIVDILLGGSFVSDERVVSYLTKMNTKYDFSVATINSTDIKVDEKVFDEEVEKFYDEHSQEYVQPQMYSASMVKFESKNFESSVLSPDGNELLEFFGNNRKAFSLDADFEELKGEVRKSYIIAKANMLAYSAAEDFVNKLYENSIALESEQFLTTLDEFNATKSSILAFSETNLPKLDGINAAYLLDVCDLGLDRYYSDPHPATFGGVVFLLDGTMASRNLNLDEARSAVSNDIIREKKLQAFADKIEEIRKKVATATEGNDVADIFRKQGAEVKSYSGISVNNAEEYDLDPLYREVIASFRGSEKIKLLPVSNDEVLMFVVTKKTFPSNESFSKENFLNAELLLKNLRKNLLQVNFFNSQALKIAP